jgi:hypothetical protein
MQKKKRSLVSNTNESAVSSFSSASDDHKSLGTDHDQTPEAQAPSLNAGSSCAMPPHKEGVCSYGMYVLGSTLLNGSPTTQCKFVFCAIKKIKNNR